MEAVIAAGPSAQPPSFRVPAGFRKLRWGGSGRGKRGGVRTLYYFHGSRETIYLLTVYAKAEQEDLRPADLKAWSNLVHAIKQEAR